jgi:predicted transcriptional regulator
MVTLHITVGERDDLREETLQFVRDAESNADPDDRAVIQFGTYDDLVDNLTPRRLELVRAIARERPESMREAARLVDRDVSDVHGDLKRLEVLGIIELEEGGPGGALQPVVPYDSIEMHVDYPLFETGDTDGASASAD